MKEVDCATLDPDCQFKGYPGTVSWKIGFQVLRDAPVDPSANEIFSETQLAACKSEAANCRRRFDQERMNFFRYALYAHIPRQAEGRLPHRHARGTGRVQSQSGFEFPRAIHGIGYR
jgi:hypothetical protein